MSPTFQSTAEILVLRNINTLYTYIIPEELQNILQPGDRVHIPLGRAKAKGIVISLSKSEANSRLKPISEIDSEGERLTQDQMDLIFWIAEQYFVSPNAAYQSIIGKRKLRELNPEDFETVEFTTPFKLSPEQEQTIKGIIESPNKKAHLIFGVTGSGKTEIYIQLCNHYISQSKQVAILLPEIALTPQFIELFKKRFGNQVAVIHSGLTPKQRDVAWSAIKESMARIAIGPRSALFAPFQQLGAIIIDEEHEFTYKQENSPRYLTHSIAEFMAQKHNFPVVLGSATPSIESYTKCNGDYLHTLSKRIGDASLPSVDVIDMTIQENQLGYFSPEALRLIEDRLQKKEKTLILLNRRGYASLVICKRCNTPLTCPECSLSFTYHKDKKFRCHRCHIVAPVTNMCTKCKKPSLEFTGSGTQKCETQLQQNFPDAEVSRLDRDSAKTHKQQEKILNQFKKSGDILIGTQLIAKGHHIPEITLVIILGIDTLLNLPDFRSPERAFQLITQVAGRAGREGKSGHVCVQTYMPDHYSIQFAKTHDFIGFYNQEIAYREALGYPPFKQIINIIVSGKEKGPINSYLKLLANYLNVSLEKQKVQIIGPKPAPIEMMQGKFRFNILLKVEHDYYSECKHILHSIPDAPSQLKVIIDNEAKHVL
jgi:primosomal protein N' (replication factor Y)